MGIIFISQSRTLRTREVKWLSQHCPVIKWLSKDSKQLGLILKSVLCFTSVKIKQNRTNALFENMTKSQILGGILLVCSIRLQYTQGCLAMNNSPFMWPAAIRPSFFWLEIIRQGPNWHSFPGMWDWGSETASLSFYVTRYLVTKVQPYPPVQMEKQRKRTAEREECRYISKEEIQRQSCPDFPILLLFIYLFSCAGSLVVAGGLLSCGSRAP